jgi:type VI secretion system protein ImpB
LIAYKKEHFMSESTQHKLDRVRPPRVQITYDVEVGDAIEKKEIPLVVGILSDLSGNPAQKLPRVKDRSFTEIDRDNFNDVLAASTPRCTFQVDNKLQADGGKMNVELNFRSMDDFTPTNVVNQIPALKKLLEARTKLKDLVSKLDGNDDLDALLQNVVNNTDDKNKLKAELGGNDGGTE